jgi:hypothetical protein
MSVLQYYSTVNFQHSYPTTPSIAAPSHEITLNAARNYSHLSTNLSPASLYKTHPPPVHTSQSTHERLHTKPHFILCLVCASVLDKY